MPLPPNNLGRASLCVAVALLLLGVPLLVSAQVASRSKSPAPKKAAKLEGYAKWYDVPPNSLTKHRAGKDELTAAKNGLPLGTKIRVTHLGNNKNVVVRITDRGVYTRGTVIDLSKEAAEKLDMIREGSARVRLEILPDDKLPASKTKTPPW
jgi:rare lipoprotein A